MAQVTNHSSPRGHTAFTFAWNVVITPKRTRQRRRPSGSVAALVLQDLGGGRLRVRRIIGVALSKNDHLADAFKEIRGYQ